MTFDLTAARLNEGKSIRGLAAEIGVPEQTIRALESGTGGAHPSNARKIAEHFKIAVTDLPAFAGRAGGPGAA